MPPLSQALPYVAQSQFLQSGRQTDLKSVVFFVYNLLTIGLYATRENLSKSLKVRQLEYSYSHVYSRIKKLDERWTQLEADLEKVVADIRQSEPADKGALLNRVKDLTARMNGLANENASNQVFNLKEGFAQGVLNVISFVGNLIANIVTIGLHGLYQNHQLRGRIQELTLSEQTLRNQSDVSRKEKEGRIARVIQSLPTILEVRNRKNILETQLDLFKNSDPKTIEKEAQALLARAAKEIPELIAEEAAISVQVNAALTDDLQAAALLAVKLKSQQAAAEEIKKLGEKIGATRGPSELLERQKLELVDAINKENQKARAKKREGASKTMTTLQDELKAAIAKGRKVEELKQQAAVIKRLSDFPDELQQIAEQTGDIPLAYQRQADDPAEIKGAMDEGSTFPETFSEDYIKRYGDKRSAFDVFAAAFEHVSRRLLTLAEGGDKLKLNKSGMTVEIPSIMNALYCFSVIDLVEGARMVFDGCGAVQEKLEINDHVAMAATSPERVIQFKPEGGGLGLTPVLELRYKYQDDFTPDAAILKSPEGVNPVALKLIMARLNPEEKRVLFNLLLASIIPNEHPDYIEMRAHMANQRHSVVDQEILFFGALELIGTIAGKRGINHKELVTDVLNKLRALMINPPANLERLTKSAEDLIERIDSHDGHDDELLEAVKQHIMDAITEQEKMRVGLIQTAADLIQNITNALTLKFGKTAISQAYNEIFDDYDIQPYVKEEEDWSKSDKVADVAEKKKTVEWKLTPEILGSDYQLRVLVAEARNNYQILYQAPDLLEYRYAPHQKIKGLTWEEIGKQYNISQEMLGIWQEVLYHDAVYKGEHCLFSNLIALLSSKREDIKGENIGFLRNAMANYIENLREIRAEWDRHPERHADPKSYTAAAKKMNEQVALIEKWEKEIRKIHKCETIDYIDWLEKENNLVDEDRLTDLEIEIAAYTLGVRIGVFELKEHFVGQVDKHGRLFPSDEMIFGPDTKEILFLSNKLNAFNGVFPKLKSTAGGGLKTLDKHWRVLDKKRQTGLTYEQAYAKI